MEINYAYSVQYDFSILDKDVFREVRAYLGARDYCIFIDGKYCGTMHMGAGEWISESEEVLEVLPLLAKGIEDIDGI